MVTACAEFPNDNDALHDGAMWGCETTTSRATMVGEPARRSGPMVEAREGAAPAAPEGPPTEVASEGSAVVEQEADDFEIEIVAELPLGEVVDESSEPSQFVQPGQEEECRASEAAPGDAFGLLAGLLESVASEAGGEGAAGPLRALLGLARIDAASLEPRATEALISAGILVAVGAGAARDERFVREVLGWQGVLRGESEDFAACGAAPLDQWCAKIIAAAMGTPARVEGFRRELRRRGVAAFGLVDVAA